MIYNIFELKKSISAVIIPIFLNLPRIHYYFTWKKGIVQKIFYL